MISPAASRCAARAGGAGDPPARGAAWSHGGGLDGHIAKAAYLGDHMEYQVAVDGLAKGLFVIDANVAVPLEVGACVGIVLDAAGAALVPP